MSSICNIQGPLSKDLFYLTKVLKLHYKVKYLHAHNTVIPYKNINIFANIQDTFNKN
jgi:hypothetical protein